jgi:hypothetical protein
MECGMNTTIKQSKEEKIVNDFHRLVEIQLAKKIIEGDDAHFHNVLDEYHLHVTNSKMEQLRLLFNAGLEQGIRTGSRIVMEEWRTVIKKIYSEGK